MNNRNNATIKDVAEQANVSTATVGRVLNGRGYVSEEARERVETAISQLGYRKNVLAMGLRKQHTQTIGHLLTSIALNPFFSGVSLGVERQAMEYGYSVLIYNVQGDATQEQRGVETFIERRVDGIVVASGRATRRLGRRLAELPIPVVLVNADVRWPGVAVIGTTQRTGARLAAEHLLGLGHRRLAFVGAPAGHAAGGPRRAGVLDALRAAGLGADALEIVPGDGRVEGGAASVERLLEGRARPTGIVAYNDLAAIGILRGLRSVGLRVPADASVVGFDDIEPASWTEPPLTTIRQPTTEMGRWAVERIAGALRGAASDDRVALEPELIVRGSTGPPPGPPPGSKPRAGSRSPARSAPRRTCRAS